MSTTTTCPNCGRDVGDTPDVEPDHDTMLACAPCGFTGIWDEIEHRWREMTPEERARIMTDPDYLDVMSYSMMFRQFQERDRDRLMKLIAEHTPLDSITAARLTKAIQDTGFHTHISEADLIAPAEDS